MMMTRVHWIPDSHGIKEITRRLLPGVTLGKKSVSDWCNTGGWEIYNINLQMQLQQGKWVNGH